MSETIVAGAAVEQLPKEEKPNIQNPEKVEAVENNNKQE